MLTPRPSQAEILRYEKGKMAVSAVPGSGKTWTLSRLAASIISRGFLAEGQEVLVVTLTNSAVENFKHRIRDALSESVQSGLLPRYRVRTLHGLAHDMLRENPGAIGLDAQFSIIDEAESAQIRRRISLTWLREHAAEMDAWLKEDLPDDKRAWIQRKHLPEYVENLALSFIKSAKAANLSPERISALMANQPAQLALAHMGLEMYADYQRGLAAIGALDFDDLTCLALQTLERDAEYLARLQQRFPYILEDEAQDSNPLQEKIMRLLTAGSGNWVRVGDPNQAIFETFTTASPKYLRRFMGEPGVQAKELPHSGRSTQSVIDCANELIHWSQTQAFCPQAADALSPPEILPAPPGDAAPNPPDSVSSVYFHVPALTSQDEIRNVASSLERYLPQHPENTVAVLASTNRHAAAVVDELQRRNLPVVDDLLRTSSIVRSTAHILMEVLDYLNKPDHSGRLADVYAVWRNTGNEEDVAEEVRAHAVALKRCSRLEEYVYPRPDRDWLVSSGYLRPEEAYATDTQPHALVVFRAIVRRWLGTLTLPVDQMILTVAQDLFHKPEELALVYDLASLLRRLKDLHPEWHLDDIVQELRAITQNERAFNAIGEANAGFNPEEYRGQIVVCTVHKAKGLEWDRVYLTSVNNYDYPFGQQEDTYIAERWFIRRQYNLEAEMLAQFHALLEQDEYDAWSDEALGEATLRARIDFVRERLRLFFVGVTRARRELIVTWNTGMRGGLTASLPFRALAERKFGMASGSPASLDGA